ncbi:MAG: hypothetical protein U5K43_00400 [Halofilum sp. (in: g-proteobacteria)]|nr:hypothetical protein [Halofilum sp. (in: g-proteobacteria)]
MAAAQGSAASHRVVDRLGHGGGAPDRPRGWCAAWRRAGRRLVMDVGGGLDRASSSASEGSAVGEGDAGGGLRRATASASSATGASPKKAFERQAELAARVEIRPIETRLSARWTGAARWASGTIKAVANALQEAGWSAGSITAAGLERLAEEPDRRTGTSSASTCGGEARTLTAVFPGGAAILRAAFTALGVDEMALSRRRHARGPAGRSSRAPRARRQPRGERLVAPGDAVPRLDGAPRTHTASCARPPACSSAMAEQRRGSRRRGREWLLSLGRWSCTRSASTSRISAGPRARRVLSPATPTSPAPGRAQQAQLAAPVRAHRRKFPLERSSARPAAPTPRCWCAWPRRRAWRRRCTAAAAICRCPTTA